MRYRTVNNMTKATQMIADKGYDWEEANQMAIKIFDNYMNKNSNSVEFYIDMIMPKREAELTRELGRLQELYTLSDKSEENIARGKRIKEIREELGLICKPRADRRPSRIRWR